MVSRLIVHHGLWEQGDEQGEGILPAGHKRAVLFNAATVLTLSAGVIAFYGLLLGGGPGVSRPGEPGASSAPWDTRWLWATTSGQPSLSPRSASWGAPGLGLRVPGGRAPRRLRLRERHRREGTDRSLTPGHSLTRCHEVPVRNALDGAVPGCPDRAQARPFIARDAAPRRTPPRPWRRTPAGRRASAGHQPLVHHDLLVDHFRAGVAQVCPDAGPLVIRPALDHAGLDVASTARGRCVPTGLPVPKKSRTNATAFCRFAACPGSPSRPAAAARRTRRPTRRIRARPPRTCRRPRGRSRAPRSSRS